MILNGSKTAEVIRKKIKEEVVKLDAEIKLSIIQVGDNQASSVYLESKEKACDDVGIICETHKFTKNTSQKDIINYIEEQNKKESVHAIMVQMPLPSHINTEDVLNAIDPMKDVDGLSIVNQGKLFKGLPCVQPATAQGIITLLKNNNLDITSKNVVIVGRSIVVGKPLAMLFLQENATVTICHSHTVNLKEVTKRADILVVASGKPNTITADMVKKDAIVIDVGINKVLGRITGDVDFAEVSNVASYITPVPNGVGPMTTAVLLQNILKCYNEQQFNKL